jgi:hypothetical protein
MRALIVLKEKWKNRSASCNVSRNSDAEKSSYSPLSPCTRRS